MCECYFCENIICESNNIYMGFDKFFCSKYCRIYYIYKFENIIHYYDIIFKDLYKKN